MAMVVGDDDVWVMPVLMVHGDACGAGEMVMVMLLVACVCMMVMMMNGDRCWR